LKEDSERLELAEKFGAITVNIGEEDLEKRVLDLTEGKG